MMLCAGFLPSDLVVEDLRELTGRLGSVGMTPVPPDHLYVLITRFGNLTEDIGTKLAHALANGLGDAPRPVVWFGAPRVTDDGDVVVDLRGDVAGLSDLARAVPMIAEQRRLYVDRRVFRPELVVARTGLAPGSPLVERMLAGTSSWSSQAWETDGISLMRTRWQSGDDRSEEFLFIPLDARVGS